MPLSAIKSGFAAAVPACTAGFLLFLLPVDASLAQDDSTNLENKEIELENLRSRIRDVRSRLDAASQESEALQKDIQQAEQAAVAAAARLRELESDIQTKTDRLEQLERESARWQKNLEARRDRLARHVRIAYQTGHHDFLKLLLNQEDPALVGRMVAYHDYHNRARARNIEAVKESLKRLAHLQASIREETATLQDLRTGQAEKLEEHRRYRASRQEAIGELQAYIDEQDAQLQILENNEKELAALLDRLKSEQLAIHTYEELPPFQSLRGKLSWPVSGRFLHHFNEPRKGGKLRAHGVRIAADSGADVRAVSTGKVIFADWFRNMGLLMIIDHGDGFMSLYGNNERLLKKPGDMVGTGEVIARVGDTGGQNESGLYFEIRQQGNPKNPALWCRR